MEHQYHKLWEGFRIAAEPAMQRFAQSHTAPREQQLAKLNQIIESGKHTEFGRTHQFSAIHSYEDFAAHVPIADWQATSVWVDKVSHSSHPILSAESPLFFEPTSGSSAKRKLIPYTPQLLVEFQSAIIVWLASLYDACPAIANGRAYWSMSPQVQTIESTSNGTPIGCGSDIGYLRDSIVLPLLQSVLNPPGLNDDAHSSLYEWRIKTLVALIDADDLSMISVWSPTFLLTLLAPMLQACSSLTLADKEVLNTVRDNIKRHRLHAFDLACDSANFSALWPRLMVVSTWTSGPSQVYADRLAACFPQTNIVPKGLLATEGVVSISYGLTEHCPLALDSHFLEFLCEDGSVLLADDLQPGNRYQPLLTTGGGFYRYRLGDVVEASKLESTASVNSRSERSTDLLCINFIGRADTRCDLAGEKLDEKLVQTACKSLTDSGVSYVLVPNTDGTQPGYVLIVGEKNPDISKCMRDKAERGLMNIHHYAQAYKLGQIAPLELHSCANVAVLLQSAWESSGQVAGDYKPSVLVSSLPLAQAILKHCHAGTEAAQ